MDGGGGGATLSAAFFKKFVMGGGALYCRLGCFGCDCSQVSSALVAMMMVGRDWVSWVSLHVQIQISCHLMHT